MAYPDHFRPAAYPGSSFPFVSGQIQHPLFSPAPAGRPGDSDIIKRELKMPKAPDKPLMAYMRFSKKVWEKVRTENSNYKPISEIGKLIGSMWRELPDDEKKVYWADYEIDKSRYDEILRQYKLSPAYQQYMSEKARQEAASRQTTDAHAFPKVHITACEEDDGMSLKNVAHERYSRNQQLMAEIFGGSIIPDGRTVITQRKLAALKAQVNSLEEHRRKLEEELQQLNDRHGERKRKILAARDEFDGQYSEACLKKPNFTEEDFEELVEKSKVELRERQKFLEEQRKIEEAKKAEAEAAAAAAKEAASGEEEVGQLTSTDATTAATVATPASDAAVPEVEDVSDPKPDGPQTTVLHHLPSGQSSTSLQSVHPQPQSAFRTLQTLSSKPAAPVPLGPMAALDEMVAVAAPKQLSRPRMSLVDHGEDEEETEDENSMTREEEDDEAGGIPVADEGEDGEGEAAAEGNEEETMES